MKGMGKRKIQMSIGVDEVHYIALRNYAKNRNLSISQIIRLAVEKYLKLEQKEEKSNGK